MQSLFAQGCQWSNRGCLYNWRLQHGSQIIKKKCDDLYHKGIHLGTNLSEDNIAFLPLKERFDIMTYCYPLDNLSSNSCFYYNSDVWYHIATRRMNEHDWKHQPSCFKYVKECRASFPRQSCKNTKLKKTKMLKTNAHNGNLWWRMTLLRILKSWMNHCLWLFCCHQCMVKGKDQVYWHHLCASPWWS